MIDTHAHLTSKQYDRDRDAVIQRARKAGVTLEQEIAQVEEELADLERRWEAKQRAKSR